MNVSTFSTILLIVGGCIAPRVALSATSLSCVSMMDNSQCHEDSRQWRITGPLSLKTITVLIDSREQRPLLFPDTLALWSPRGAGHNLKACIVKVKTERRRLDAGDYCLLGDEALAIVERKADIGEIITNTLTGDRPRFLRALERLAAGCTFPYLYVERFPASWWRPAGGAVTTSAISAAWNMTTPLNVVQAMDLLLADVTRLGIRLLWGNNAPTQPSGRRRMGELILRILLAHQENDNGK